MSSGKVSLIQGPSFSLSVLECHQWFAPCKPSVFMFINHLFIVDFDNDMPTSNTLSDIRSEVLLENEPGPTKAWSCIKLKWMCLCIVYITADSHRGESESWGSWELLVIEQYMKLTLVVLEGFLIQSHRLDDVMQRFKPYFGLGRVRESERDSNVGWRGGGRGVGGGGDESLPHWWLSPLSGQIIQVQKETQAQHDRLMALK